MRYVLPNAPERPVTINGGYVMRAWYDILGLNGQRGEDEAGLRESQALVEALIARETARGVPAERIVLAGFSQGCAMTLMTGLRHPQRLAGAGRPVGLPAAGRHHRGRAQRRRTRRRRSSWPTAAHDPMIALPRAAASRDALQALGYGVDGTNTRWSIRCALEEVARPQSLPARRAGPLSARAFPFPAREAYVVPPIPPQGIVLKECSP